VPGLAVEYYHAEFDHYFITAIDAEISALDAGRFIGWTRTGLGFDVFQSTVTGTSPVCRFFSTAFAPKSSHFYTPDVNECAIVKLNASWSFEGQVFSLALPSATGTCPAGTVPLYRMYNNGKGGAPNHRYTQSAAVRSQMQAQGWISEGYGSLGVIGCNPL
jgi:hypothetical protein